MIKLTDNSVIEKLFYTVKYFKQYPEYLENTKGIKTVYFIDKGKWFWGEFKNNTELDKFMAVQNYD